MLDYIRLEEVAELHEAMLVEVLNVFCGDGEIRVDHQGSRKVLERQGGAQWLSPWQLA
ncbi:hypothetical protein ACWGDT_30010 [Streptomyces avermitilis]